MKFIALILLGCFATLSSYSIGKYHPDAKPAVAANAKRKAPASRPAEPVILTKNGYVIYDSKSRAEVIAKIWNITAENINAQKEWW